MNAHFAPGMRQAASVAGIACLFAVQFVYFLEGRGLSSMLLNLSQVTGALWGGLLFGALLFSARVMRSWAGVICAGALTVAGSLLWTSSTGDEDVRGLVACMAGGMLLPPLLHCLFDAFARPGGPLGLAFGLGDFFWLFLFVLPVPPLVEEIQHILTCLHVGGGLMTMLCLWQQREAYLASGRHTSALPPLLSPARPLLQCGLRKGSLISFVLVALGFFFLNALIDLTFYRLHEVNIPVPGYVHLYIWLVYPLAGLCIERRGASLTLLLFCLGGNLLSLLNVSGSEGSVLYWIVYFISLVCRDVALMYLLLGFSRFRRDGTYPCMVVAFPCIIMFLSYWVAYEWVRTFPNTIFTVLLFFALVILFSYIRPWVQYVLRLISMLQHGKKSIDAQVEEKEGASDIALGYFSEKYGITTREQDVLQLIIEGYDTTQISESLYLSENTIKSHVRKLLHKTETRNRVALTALVFNEARKTPDAERDMLEAHRELHAQ